MNLPGYIGASGGPTLIAVGGPQQSTAANVPNGATAVPAVIDGTPIRVVAIGFAAALALYAFKVAGYRFNVGVSTR